MKIINVILSPKRNEFYPLFNELYEVNLPYFNCTKNLEGYYLDQGDYLYKLCYQSCEICYISGDETNHNCIKCKNNYNYEMPIGLYKNCYQNCSYYHYRDETDNNLYCTKSEQCPEEYNKLIENKKECVSSCQNNEYKFEFHNRCHEKCPLNSTERNNTKELEKFLINGEYFCKHICTEEFPFELILSQQCLNNCDTRDIINGLCILNYQNEEYDKIKIYDTILKNIENMFMSNDYNTSSLEQGNNEIFIYEELTVSLTTVLNQINDKNNSNISTIDIGDCERILKDECKIPYNQSLFMRKIDVIQTGMKIPKIEFDVYTKLNGTHLTKLNLSYCSNSKIDISIPTLIDGNLDELNSSSGYYNDICYTTTSESGTDIIINDRKKEFIENNKTLCQENCVFSQYDNNTKKVKCSCEDEGASPSFAYMKINKTKLYKNFIDIKNIANINLLVCYEKLFSKKGILKNYGSFSLIPIVISNFVILIIFYAKNLFKTISDQIRSIKIAKYNFEMIKKEKELPINNKGKKRHNHHKKEETKKIKMINNTYLPKFISINNSKSRLKKNPVKRKNNKNKIIFNKNNNNILNNNNNNKKSIINLKLNSKNQQIIENPN